MRAALSEDVMRHGSLAASFMVPLVTILVAQSAVACSPALPLKTLGQSVASAESVYLAKLVTFARAPLPHDPTMTYSALETATFAVLQTIKGMPPKGRTLRTRTDVTGGNCALSLLVPYEEVRGGKLVPPKLSGTWILVLSGTEPYWLDSLSGTVPEEAVPKAELARLLQSAGKASGAK